MSSIPDDTEELTAEVDTVLRSSHYSGSGRKLHVADVDGTAACGCVAPDDGWYQSDLAAYPPASRRWCVGCLTVLRGDTHRKGPSDRECPFCGADVFAPDWPGHIAECDER